MPKIVDHDQYRKKLLIKSFDLFAQKGYSAVTMRQLAHGLGVSTGTLYHYFPSKEALFLQLIEELDRQDILNFLAEAGNPSTLAERMEILLGFVAKNEDYFLKQTLLWLEFCQQQDGAELLSQDILKNSQEQTKQVIADYLQISDTAIADLLCKFLFGLIVGRLFEGKQVPFAQQAELLTEMLTAYLEQTPPMKLPS
jgi:AcrR family transcriptional regulator